MASTSIDPTRIDAALGALTHAATDIGGGSLPGDAAAAARRRPGRRRPRRRACSPRARPRASPRSTGGRGDRRERDRGRARGSPGRRRGLGRAAVGPRRARRARVRTFPPTTWFAKPEALNPIACSRHGWVNGASDELHCRACGGTLAFRFSGRLETHSVDAAARAFAPQLRAAHKPLCVWHDDACPDEFARVPARTPAQARAEFAARAPRCRRDAPGAADGPAAPGAATRGDGLPAVADRSGRVAARVEAVATAPLPTARPPSWAPHAPRREPARARARPLAGALAPRVVRGVAKPPDGAGPADAERLVECSLCGRRVGLWNPRRLPAPLAAEARDETRRGRRGAPGAAAGEAPQGSSLRRRIRRCRPRARPRPSTREPKAFDVLGEHRWHRPGAACTPGGRAALSTARQRCRLGRLPEALAAEDAVGAVTVATAAAARLQNAQAEAEAAPSTSAGDVARVLSQLV